MGGQGPSKHKEGKADRDDGHGGGKRQKVIRCHNQSGLLQRSMRHTQINPGLGLSPQGGSKSTPRARIAVRPKLARSCWFDTMMGKSLRKTGTERERDRVSSTRKCCRPVSRVLAFIGQRTGS
jgi:hypothetical protein